MGDLQAKLKEVYPNLSTGQCVELAQQMGGVGNVHEWERGAPVAQVRPPIGAVVSTFGWNGDSDKYAYGGSGTPGIGRDHAGIVAGYDDNGMLLLNQWKGQEPTYTHYNWDGTGEHGASNYYIINQGGKPAGVNATLLNPQSTGSDMSNAPGSKRGGAVDKAMGLVRKKRAGGGALEDAIMGFANQRAAGVNRPVTSGSMAPASQNWQGQTHLASVSPPPAQSDQSVIRDAGDLGRSAEAAYGTLSGRDKALPNTGPVSNGSAPASYNGDPKKADRSTVEAYIRDRAKAYGIDPDVAVAVAKSEGLNAFDPTKPDLGGDEHSSFGPFQLHYGGVSQNMPHPGMGDDFTKATGMHASDPSSWPQQVDFALSHASNNGWNAWSGARDSAGRFLGLGQNSLPSMTYGIGGQRSPAPTTQDAGTQNYGRPAQTSFADPSQSYQPQQTAMTTGVSYPQANPQAALVEGRPAPQKDPSQQDNSPAATNAARGGSIVDQAMRMTRRRHRDAGGATTPAPAASGPADGSGWFGQATPPGKNDITPSSLANDQNFPSNGGHISTDQMMELLSATVGGNFPRSGSGGDQTTPAPAAPATPTIPKGTVGNSYNIQGAPGGSAATGHYDNTLNEVLGTNNPNMTQVFGFNYPGGSGPSNVPPGGFGTVPMAVPHAATGSPLGGDGSKAYIGAKRGGSIVDKAMALSRSTRKRKA